ncbi:MAG: hypothetical protein GY756_09210 [bacterium]|nr:hypothetical protein [bacterium]
MYWKNNKKRFTRNREIKKENEDLDKIYKQLHELCLKSKLNERERRYYNTFTVL